jgi:methylated-DNA-protein-cysteine methyltransferase-like protein
VTERSAIDVPEPTTTDTPDDRLARVVAVLLALGPGEVATYGDVAETAGLPGRARWVGRLLAEGAHEDLPWWRVVNAAGRLVPGHEAEQAALLRAEDVTVRDGRVVEAPIGRFSRRPGRPDRSRS